VPDPATRAAAFLTQIGRTLGATLDVDTTLEAIGGLAVPQLADGCVVQLLNENGQLSHAAIRHILSVREPSLGELLRLDPVGPPAPTSPIAQVLRTGEPRLASTVTEATLGSVAADEHQLRELGLLEYLVLPLMAEANRVIGAVAFVMTEGDRRFRSEDLELARELSSRAAQAVANAHSYARARHSAAESQRVATMLDAMLAAAPVGLGFVDRELRYVRVNHQLAAMNGLSVEAHLGRTVREVLPDLSPTLEPLLRGVFATGRPTGSTEVSGFTPAHPGERHWWEVNYFPVPEAGGGVAVAGIAAIDVTSHREALEAVQSSESLLSQVLDTLPVGVWIQDATGRITKGNQAGVNIWSGARYVGPEDFGEYQGWWTETGERIAPDEWAAARTITRGETCLNEHVTIQCFDGTRKDILNSAVPLRDAEGRIVGGIIVNEDVTDRRQAEIEIRAQSALAAQRLAQLEATYATAPVGLCVLDRELRFIRINERMAELNGVSVAAHIGRTVREIVPDLAAKAEPMLRRILETGEPVLGMELTGETLAKPGAERTWVEHWFPLRDASGEISGINVVAEEITEQKRMAEALRRLEQLEATGRLAGGIAHEANNQMTVVLGAVHFLEDADLPPRASQDLALIRQAATRTADVTRQLLAFSRRQMIQSKVAVLDDVVKELEPMLRSTLGDRVVLECRLDSGGTAVRIAPELAKQVLLHLVLNARDAMPDGGECRIETCLYISAGDRQIGLAGTSIPVGRYVRLVVTDSGTGMGSETLNRLFEPFFTTKPVGQGTGLGLAMAYGAVKQMGGYIGVESTPGTGTTFEIFLPAV
jgi:PAS domain S-box-containing protein